MEQGNIDEWGREWGRFLASIRMLFQQKLIRQPHTLPREDAMNLLNDVMGLLGAALASLPPERLEGIIRDAEPISSLLLRELRLFNHSVRIDLEQGRQEPELLNLRLEQAQTIKDSIQEQIERLPERVKKILSILDELLSLVKG